MRPSPTAVEKKGDRDTKAHGSGEVGRIMPRSTSTDQEKRAGRR